MPLAVAFSRAQQGVASPLVSVEVHLANGLPGLSIVGLPEAAVKESKDRVRAALQNSGFQFPPRRITVNLAPADLPKAGGRYDLAIALGILSASGQLDCADLGGCEYLGELALSGALRSTGAVLPAALAARKAGRALMVAAGDADEAALVDSLTVWPANHLLEVCAHLNRRQCLTPHAAGQPVQSRAEADLAEVRGQAQAKRALEIAAAGGHSLLMVGPPGTGKTMLARRLPGILPLLSEAEALEVAAVASVSRGGFEPATWRRRPFRAPHHSASGIALVGGGTLPKPGEISLAHHGVLFLDELPEFDRRVLEMLREPLETGRIHISRAAQQVEYPARFQLVAAMNPCPCGYLGDARHECRCTEEQVWRYRRRLSGPLLDRFDMHLEVPPVPHRSLAGDDPTIECSSTVRARVAAARARSWARSGCASACLDSAQTERHCRPSARGVALLRQAMERLGLSARAYHRILRLARTLADLDDADRIGSTHVSEALCYRRLDRQGTPGRPARAALDR